MGNVTNTLEAEAEILRRIDEQVQKMSPEIRGEAFQILVRRHLGGYTEAMTESIPAPKVTGKKSRRPKSGSDLAVIRDLNLKNDKDRPSLREFYSEKKPASYVEHNTLFIFYLNRLCDIDTVTPSHVYTCYADVGARKPGAFYQSLLDTSRKGWIDTSDTERIRVTTVGENFVEHDLPRDETL